VRRPSRTFVLLGAVGAVAALLSGCSNAVTGRATPAAEVTSSSIATSSSPAAGPSSTTTSPAALPASPAAAPPSLQNASSAVPPGQTLPLSYSTGSASQVITVVASSTGSTTATLQAWDKVGSGWTAHGAAITAHVGSAGLSTHPSESVSATPIGSFALNRAFGYDTNPGTALSYHQTTSADWWISQEGPLYNTMQTCSSSCGFTQGDPNEHLSTTRPQYAYAVVIEYNTTPPIVAGAGSAFFLHVTDGTPTAGCVAIPQANLVSIMQWLNPAAQPRILIGLR
jgi:L,D-peptidoglycan transpeptidase YkuD (ErfK/YbiS/YcfS/YnhG family)